MSIIWKRSKIVKKIKKRLRVKKLRKKPYYLFSVSDFRKQNKDRAHCIDYFYFPTIYLFSWVQGLGQKILFLLRGHSYII